MVARALPGVELRGRLVRIRVGILLGGLDVALARLGVLLLCARRALARECVLALRLSRLRLGFGARSVRLRATDLGLAPNPARLLAARLVPAVPSRTTYQPQQRQNDQRADDDCDDDSGIHTFSSLGVSEAGTRQSGRYAYFAAFSSSFSSSSTSSRFSTLPVALRGSSSMNSISRGTL